MPQAIEARTYNVRDFGAKGDGATLDTKALQDAVDACHRDRGGTVVVAAGTFVIGTADGTQYHAAPRPDFDRLKRS
jgi:polygalacturonase